ncbi:hemin-degrading factor [Parapedobacter koreensis]|uniref:Putative hemin transport protein n=1 Tax=Parapedobacter koreensis TaxID=332977 RepID=A0A1H7P900_9SPHI|nr:ChuX/HutX family heme-like substrate-binding protein [Parapedobacter koreensis]SEL31944.1 putative hemin transport protein [Parapedobacter koreensis]
MENTTVSLKEQYQSFKTENPKVRIRDAARQLGVSEADLVATGDHNISLKPEFEDILKEISSLGHVMALTRNDHAVHERKGVYTKATFNGHIGLVVNPDIDLRLFMNAWHFGFAVQEGDRQSLQFFDKDGEAVHKIYLTEQSDMQAYEVLIEKYRAPIQNGTLQTTPIDKSIVESPDNDVEAAGFRQAWLDLKDTHNFFGLLRDFGVARRQAMRLAPEGHAIQITIPSLKRILEGVSERDLEIMVFIGSRGCIQIHTGKVKKLLQTGPWFNVLDPAFNMHLREDGIESVWLVRKPTEDGIVTSLEAFDMDGNVIVQFFGKRKPRIPEREDWRQVIADYAVIQ